MDAVFEGLLILLAAGQGEADQEGRRGAVRGEAAAEEGDQPAHREAAEELWHWWVGRQDSVYIGNKMCI